VRQRAKSVRQIPEYLPNAKGLVKSKSKSDMGDDVFSKPAKSETREGEWVSHSARTSGVKATRSATEPANVSGDGKLTPAKGGMSPSKFGKRTNK